MLKSGLVDVLLPDGEVVKISNVALDWWDKQNASGYVHPDMIAPDLDNPRKRMNSARLAELNESVKARGVRQQLVITPRHLVPWARVAPEHKDRYFVAVGGHRRRNAASIAGIGAVPIKVSVYKSEKDHRMDMSLLNKGQDDLTPLEEGFEIVALRKLDWTVDELCKSFGLALPQYYQRINLTKLCPEFQALLDEDVDRSIRLTLGMGGALGGVKVPTAEELDGLFDDFKEMVKRDQVTKLTSFEDLDEDDLRFTLQRLLYAVIKRRHLSSTQAVEFIKDLTLKFESSNGAGPRVRRYEPTRRREIISGLVDGVTKSLVVNWSFPELERIFANASREEVEATIAQVKHANSLFATLVESLDRIKSKKRATNPEVEALMARGRAKATA